MSEEAKAAEAKTEETPQMNPADVIMDRVFVPEFVKVCAARGVSIQTQDELDEMLKIAGMLRLHEESMGGTPQTEQASVIKQASQRLEAATFGDAAGAEQYLNDPAVVAAL